jgi:hypothetical protein
MQEREQYFDLADSAGNCTEHVRQFKNRRARLGARAVFSFGGFVAFGCFATLWGRDAFGVSGFFARGACARHDTEQYLRGHSA